MPDTDPWGPAPADTTPPDTHCLNCNADGGYPYCSDKCDAASNPEGDSNTRAT